MSRRGDREDLDARLLREAQAAEEEDRQFEEAFAAFRSKNAELMGKASRGRLTRRGAPAAPFPKELSEDVVSHLGVVVALEGLMRQPASAASLDPLRMACAMFLCAATERQLRDMLVPAALEHGRLLAEAPIKDIHRRELLALAEGRVRPTLGSCQSLQIAYGAVRKKGTAEQLAALEQWFRRDFFARPRSVQRRSEVIATFRNRRNDLVHGNVGGWSHELYESLARSLFGAPTVSQWRDGDVEKGRPGPALIPEHLDAWCGPTPPGSSRGPTVAGARPKTPRPGKSPGQEQPMLPEPPVAMNQGAVVTPPSGAPVVDTLDAASSSPSVLTQPPARADARRQPPLPPSAPAVALAGTARTDLGDPGVRDRVRGLVELFDAVYDTEYRHHVCLGHLESLGAFLPRSPSDPVEQLACAVGAWWCRIVSADVAYEYHEALQLADRSRALAESLEQRLDTKHPDVQWHAYAAARWFDGAGKASYRAGDHTEGRRSFERAVTVAVEHDLWWCLADLRSNLERGATQEKRTVGTAPGPPEERYRPLIEDAIRVANLHGIAALRVGEVTPPESPRDREHLRGLCSLYHNGSDELSSSDEELSLSWSRGSEVIARANGDAYRLAQALGHQTRLHKSRAEKSSGEERSRHLDQAAGLCRESIDVLPWVRGRLIARQNLAEIRLLQGDVGEARALVEGLVDELEEARARPSAQAGFDLDRQTFALAAYHKVITEMERQGDDVSSARIRWLRERLRTVESQRKVVTVGQHKAALASHVAPVYREAVAASLRRAPLRSERVPSVGESREDALAYVEEASARELLDLMQGASRRAPAEGIAALPEVPLFADIQVSQPARKRKGMRVRRRGTMRRTDGVSGSGVDAAIGQRRTFYEQWMLNHPIPTSGHDEDLGRTVRGFTTNHPDVAVIRYFEHVEGERVALGAFVFRGARMEFVDDLQLAPVRFAWDAYQGRLQADPDTGPTVELAQAMSDHLLAPLWKHVCGGAAPPELLVIIPCGELFRYPLHVAFEPKTRWPLAASLPCCFSVSAAAFVSRSRHLLRVQTIEPGDDLCVLALLDENTTGRELKGLDWPREDLHWAGTLPEWAPRVRPVGPASRATLGRLTAPRPEVFVYTGHGLWDRRLDALGPALALEGDVLTQFDIAASLRLARNKLTVLGACVTGQGADAPGGEVSGFLRAFIAAGSGALVVTLWSVLDAEMVNVAGSLLRRVRASIGRPIDLPRAVYEAHLARCKSKESAQERIEACPLVLYL